MTAALVCLVIGFAGGLFIGARTEPAPAPTPGVCLCGNASCNGCPDGLRY